MAMRTVAWQTAAPEHRSQVPEASVAFFLIVASVNEHVVSLETLSALAGAQMCRLY
jgi:hypothetical protein